MKETNYKNFIIQFLGHAGFRVENPDLKISFAIDPFQVADVQPVDYIFITHSHYDHCDEISIKKMMKPETKIIGPNDILAELQDIASKIKTTFVGEEFVLGKLKITTIPSYNINKFRNPNEVFHTKEKGWLGFIIETEGIRFYHAGDADFIPEMKELEKIDVAFLPISGTYVMTVEEAVQAAIAIGPKLAIPMHFGKILGSSIDAQRYSNLLHGKVNVAVLS